MTPTRPHSPRLYALQHLRRRVDQAIVDEVAHLRAEALKVPAGARETGNCRCGGTGLPEPHDCGVRGCEHA